MRGLSALFLLFLLMPSHIVTYAVFSLLIILNQYMLSIKVKTIMIRGDIIFLVSFLIVHLLWPVLNLVLDVEYQYSNDTVLNYLAQIIFFSVLSFSLGFHLVSPSKNRSKKVYSDKFLITYGNNIDICLLVLLTTFYITAGKSYFLAEVYKTGGSSDTISGLAGYLYSIIIILIFLRITVISKTHKFFKSKNLKLFIVLLGSFFISSVIAGDRSFIVSLFLGLAAFIPFSNFKLSKFKMASGFVGFMILLGFVRIWRSNTLSYVNFSDLMFATVMNLADSFRVFVYANEIVNTEGVYQGLTWLGPLSGLVPFLQGMLVDMNILSLKTLNSPNVFTLYKHKTLDLTGEGSTIASDLLLNFGPFGVIFGMLVLGVLFKKAICVNPFQKSIINTYSAVILIAFSVYISRSSIIYPLKFIAWGAIINVFLYTISSLRTNE
tara:strand:- start:1455 stop:2762 length:1308 start_codon:yes stop_codon:yes gene_type:complete